MYPDAYVQYLVHFHGDRDWFECHELLEEYWKDNPDDARSTTWVMLIQVAVALYHQRRGNKAGALKMLTSALRLWRADEVRQLGIDEPRLRSALESRLLQIEQQPALPFVDLNIPLADAVLEARCAAACQEAGMLWQQPSPMHDPMIIHRHKMRDRSDVIATRQQALAQKRAARQ